MKKRTFKIIATVLALVLVFMSVSVATSAEEAEEKYPVVTGAEEFDLVEVMTNKSETVFLTKAEHKKDEYPTLMVSDDLIAYNEIDIAKALPEEADYFEVVHYAVKDDLFAFVVFLYGVEVGFDEDEQGYVEQLYLLGIQIVTTKDFVDYESYAFTANWDNEDVYWDLENYGEYAAFGCVGDTFVYANTDFIVTKETELEVKGKGIYYTTTDFVNWKTCYTPETVLFKIPIEGNLVVPGISYYYSMKYTVLENSLVYAVEELEVEERPLGDPIKRISIDSTYVTANFKDYKNIYKQSDDSECYGVECFYLKEHPDFAFVIKKYNRRGDDESCFTIASADIKSGAVRTVCPEKNGGYLNLFITQDGAYFNYLEESGSYVYRFGNDLQYSRVLGMDSWAGYYGYVMNDKLYVVNGTTTYIFADGACSEYRFSDALYDGYSLQKMIALESGVFALATNDETKALVLIDDLNKTGDADLNNNINAADALKILQDATGLVTVSDQARAVADIDGNGELNSNDALRVLQYSTGLVHSLV